MRRPFSSPFLAGALLVLAGALAAVSTAATPAAASDAEGFTITDPRITESSGLAASHQHPGVYWTHNDSDDGPYLYAVDSKTGKTVATVTLSGIGEPRDVEAISIGPDNHIFVGDIGDNLGGKWDHVWIYELPEPKELKDQTVKATQYDVKYEDGARDAESLAVHPKTGRVYIVSKNEDGGALYEAPAELSASSTNVFKRVAAVDLWATDAAFSPDGKQLAVRGYFNGYAYTWDDKTTGKIKEEGKLSVPLQPQGESMTYTADGSALMYGSEGEDSEVKPGELPGGGSGPSSGGGSSASGGGSDTGSADLTGNVKVGGVVVLVALAAVFGLSRLRRRGD
ncbi:WD40 repeat domain-containing protein [Streptomyces sp. NPDC059785]|uniref:WD40 repeat domain-containing protein n=1 Tax=Streptomyces sp. NPDC059785 TaxID=3346945 RepID=UPI003647728D